MNEIMNSTANQTPIEIVLGIDKDGMTTAKKLYSFLEMDSKNYSRWCKNNILENEFAEESVDYWVFVTNEENPLGGRPTTDYRLSASFAKKLSMQSKTEKGEQARQYFLRIEEKLKETVCRSRVPSTIPEQIQLLAMGSVELTQRVDRLDQKVDRLETDLPLLGIEIDKITSAVKERAKALIFLRKGVDFCAPIIYSDLCEDKS